MSGEPHRLHAAVTRSQLIVTGREVARFALMIGLTAALGRGLDPAAFGFVSFIGTLYAVAQVVLDLGLGAVVARDAGRDASRERPLLEGSLALRAALGALVGGVVIIAAPFLHLSGPERGWLVPLALSLPLLAPGVIGVAFQLRQDQGPPAAIGLFTQALMLGGAWLGFHLGWAGATFAGLYLVRETLGPQLLWWAARVRHGIRLRPGWTGRGAGALVTAAQYVAPTALLQVVSFHLGVFAVQAAFSPEELGSYSAATRLVNPLLLLAGALVSPLLPVFARLSPIIADFSRLAARAAEVGVSIGAIGVAVTLALGRDLLQVIYEARGKGTFGSGVLDATSTVQVLALAFAAVCVGAVTTTALLSAGGERTLRRIFGVALVLNVVTFLLLMRPLGRLAAACGSAIAELWTAVAAGLALHLRGRLAVDGWRIGRALLPGAAVGAVLALLPSAWTPSMRVAAGALPIGAAVAGALLSGSGRAFRRALDGAPA